MSRMAGAMLLIGSVSARSLDDSLAMAPLSARPLDSDHFLGFNVVDLQSGNFSDAMYWYTQGAALAGARLLRYLGDWWDWRTGWCVANASAAGCEGCSNPCTGKRRRTYLIEEFGLALQRTGARAARRAPPQLAGIDARQDGHTPRDVTVT